MCVHTCVCEWESGPAEKMVHCWALERAEMGGKDAHSVLVNTAAVHGVEVGASSGCVKKTIKSTRMPGWE